MKTEVKKIDTTKREINVEVSGDIVKNKFEEVFKKIGQETKVKGFRTGHVPRDILEKNFSHLAHEQVLKELIPEVYNQALDKEGLDVIDLPEISEVKLDRNILSFKAQVQIRPEIKLKEYRKIKVKYQKITVSSDEIKRSLDALKESRKIDVIDDKFVKSLGYPNPQELEKAIEMQVYLQKENAQRQKIENEIIEDLLKDLDFGLPPALIDRQLQELVRQTKVDMVLRGVSREKIDEQEKELSIQLEPQAQKQVKVYLVMAEIAKKENIALDDHMPRRVLELLLKEAEWIAL